LGVGIYPDMTLTPFPSSIATHDPRPSNRELSLLTTRPDFHPTSKNVKTGKT